MTPSIKHLSASAIADYLECPLLFAGRRIFHWPESKPPFPWSALTLGTVVDRALTSYHRGDNPEALLPGLWSRMVQRPLVWSDGYARALGMVRLYLANVPYVAADRAQVYVKFTVPGVDVPVIGYIDRIHGQQLHDIKTTSSHTLWTQAHADQSLQATIYFMAMRAASTSNRPTFVFDVLCHEGTPSYTRIQTKRTDADLLRGRALIRGVYSQMCDGELVAKCAKGKCRWPDRCTEYGYQPGLTDGNQEMTVTETLRSSVVGWDAFS
jgi:RecB family exonuclease